MTEPLDAIAKSGEDYSYSQIHVVLEETLANAAYLSNYSYKAIKLFNEGNSQNRLLDLLKNSKHRLLAHGVTTTTRAIKFNGVYYQLASQSGAMNKERTHSLQIHQAKKLDINLCERRAMNNLLYAISNVESSGDKLLIRDIAKKHFHLTFDRLMNPNLTDSDWEPDGLVQCLRLDIHEPALYDAMQLGFKIDSGRRFADFH